MGDRDDELSAGASVSQVAHGVGGLAQWIGVADDRGELAGFDEPGEMLKVSLALPGQQRGEPLLYERR